jgi:hypothetical protein
MLHEFTSVPRTLFALLYPGLVIGLLITGGHGGTHAEDTAGMIMGFILNVGAYTALLTAIFLTVRRYRGRHNLSIARGTRDTNADLGPLGGQSK